MRGYVGIMEKKMENRIETTTIGFICWGSTWIVLLSYMGMRFFVVQQGLVCESATRQQPCQVQ